MKNSKLYRLNNFDLIKAAVMFSRKIITVSEFTKKDLIKQFKANDDKIEVIYEGVANLAKGSDSLFVAKLDNQKTLNLYNVHVHSRNFFLECVHKK